MKQKTRYLTKNDNSSAKQWFVIILVVGIVCVTALNIYVLTSMHARFIELSKELDKHSLLSGQVSQTGGGVREIEIPIVAVGTNNRGVVDHLSVKLIDGSNNVLVNTNPFLQLDTQLSSNTAVQVAQNVVGKKPAYDYVFHFETSGAHLVGGGSAGGAMTIATIAALENKPIKHGVLMTGTIEPDGSIGPVGGVYEKAQAAADAGYKIFLVPSGQSKLTYYERKIVREQIAPGVSVLTTQYQPRVIDLVQLGKDRWDMQVVEISTVEDALKYFI